MQRTVGIISLVLIAWIATACSNEVSKPKTQDPLEVRTYDYLRLIKQGNWDAVIGMHTEDTQKYYDRNEFTEWAKMFILPKVDSVYVTRIEKHKLDATVFTEFKPKTSWATYNSMESAKIKLQYVYKEGKWYVNYPEIVAKGMEQEQKEKERKARVEEWAPYLKFLSFSVENKITDDGPTLVFTGEMENTRDKDCEMVMVMVDFFDGAGKKVFNVIVVPIYVSPYEEKKGIQAKSKLKIESSISSEIPDTWSGKIEYRVFDAGPMPVAQ